MYLPIDVRKMRAEHLKEDFPEETERMTSEGTLESYLDSWEEQAETYYRSLLEIPDGLAFQLAGATRDLKATNPGEYLRRQQMAPDVAQEILVREMVLAPI